MPIRLSWPRVCHNSDLRSGLRSCVASHTHLSVHGLRLTDIINVMLCNQNINVPVTSKNTGTVQQLREKCITEDISLQKSLKRIKKLDADGMSFGRDVVHA
jgi:hypothetical protein